MTLLAHQLVRAEMQTRRAAPLGRRQHLRVRQRVGAASTPSSRNATVADEAFRWLRWPAMSAVVMLGLSLVYRCGPSRTEVHWRWITRGSVIAAVLWLLASVLFSWYAGNFGSYNKTYGSLGASSASWCGSGSRPS